MSAKRTVLKAIPIPALPGWEQRMVLIEYPPGIINPPHYHPIEGINYVLEGAVLSQWEGREIETHNAGEVFLDESITVHKLTGNAEKDKWTRFIAVYVVLVGEPNVVQY